MASLNKVFLIGNLTRDPELKYTPKGTAVCKITMAVNRTWRTDTGEKKEEVAFIDVDLFGKTADNVAQYCRKGSSLFVEGRLKLDTWEDKQTQQKRSKLGVLAETIQFLGGGKSEGGSKAATPAPASSTPPAVGAPLANEDVPF